MRPAQKAPENREDLHLLRPEHPASMRPAQKAPENDMDYVRDKYYKIASMRPAQKAPENRQVAMEVDYEMFGLQ